MVVQVGIDWARHDAVARMKCGDKTRKIKFARGIAGVEELLASARKLGGEDATLEVSIEAGDPGLATALHARGVRVYMQDAKQARRFAESLSSSGAKDDERDADILMQMLDSVRHRREPWQPPAEAQELAGILLDDHEDVESKMQRVVNQLREELVKVHPALERALKDLQCKSALTALEAAPTWQHGKELGEAGRDALLKKCRFGQARRAAVAAALAEPWVALPTSLMAARGGRVRRLVAELRQLLAQQAELDRELDRLADEVPSATPLRTTPGVGVLLAMSLLALGVEALVQGDRDDLVVRCGAAPVRRQSGKSLNTVRMRKSAPVRGRRTTYLVAMQGIRRLGWAKAQYKYLRAHGKAHGTAVRIVGRSLLRVLGAMLRSGKAYDEAKYVAGLRGKGVAWAQAMVLEEPEELAAAA